MHRRGVVFGIAVLVGMAASESVLPGGRTSAVVGSAVAAAATIGDSRAWPLLAAALGFLRAVVAAEEHGALTIRRPSRHEGAFEVVGESGTGRVVRVGARHLFVSEPPPGFPGPGERACSLLRLDPVRGRAEPSAFRAEQWAAARHLHGRARVLSAVVEVGPAPGVAAAARRLAFRIRESGRRRLGFGTADGGNLATALLLGDRRGLDDEIKGDFRHAGLAHVLALSGAHLAVLALGLATLLRVARLPRTPVALATLAFVVAYTALTGAGPPLVRASATVALATLADLAGRRSRATSALGWALGAILLARPTWRHDAGFRLSFLATGVLALLATRPARASVPGLRGRLRGLMAAIGVSALVTLGTVPELTTSFGRVSLLAPLTNLLAGMPCAATLGWGGLAVFLPWPEPVARALAAGATRAAGALLFVVRLAGDWPGGDLAWPAPPVAAIVLLLMITRRLALGGRPGRGERALAVAGAVALATASAPRDRLTMLDVGQGDAVLVEGGGGAALVDVGPPGREGFESAAAPAVRRRRFRPLDALVVTHGHLDHFGGADDLVAEERIRCLVARSDGPDLLPALANLAAKVRETGGDVRVVTDSLSLLQGRLVTRLPFRGGFPPGTDENDRSLVASWRARGAAANLLGDSGPVVHDALRRTGRLPEAPVLLIPHHGSRHQTEESLLASTGCRLAIISCGWGNPHRHPHEETLVRLRRAGAGVLRTDRDGTISLTATRGGFRVRWTRDFPGPRRLFPSFPLPAKPAIP